MPPLKVSTYNEEDDYEDPFFESNLENDEHATEFHREQNENYLICAHN